jgi:hypothetical protein
MSSAPFGYIHCRDIQNLAVLKWLAENAADHPESVTNIVGRSREYPTFVHMPQKVQGVIKKPITSSLKEIETEDITDTVGKKRTNKYVFHNGVKKSAKPGSAHRNADNTTSGTCVNKFGEEDKVVWTNVHSTVGDEVAMYFEINGKMKLFKGTVFKYGLPSKDGMMDHLYGIRFEDGDECDWDQDEYEKGLKDFSSFSVDC